MNFDYLQEKMIKEQLIARGISDKNLIQAFYQIKRHLFVNEKDRKRAYEDRPLAIGCEQTISQPYCIASMLEYLTINKEDKVLEIGTGSFFQTALLAVLAKRVFSIEIIPEFKEKAELLKKTMTLDNVELKLGNGYLGWEEYAPFNKVILSCATEKVPELLIEQLQEGGKIIFPLGGQFMQSLTMITKTKTRNVKQDLGLVRFVRMVDK